MQSPCQADVVWCRPSGDQGAELPVALELLSPMLLPCRASAVTLKDPFPVAAVTLA